MIIEGYDRDYWVTDYSLTRTPGKINLTWNYKQGSYFFIVLYDSRNTLNLEQIAEELKEKELDDKTILESHFPLYATSIRNEKLFLCREIEFRHNGEIYSIFGKELQNGVPYAISVFIAEYDKENGELHIYPVKDMERNTQFIPVKVNPSISYKTKWLSGKKLCELNIPFIQEYQEGALEYYITGIGATMEYPITARCLGEKLLILIPKDSEVVLRVADKYKKYYRV